MSEHQDLWVVLLLMLEMDIISECVLAREGGVIGRSTRIKEKTN